MLVELRLVLNPSRLSSARPPPGVRQAILVKEFRYPVGVHSARAAESFNVSHVSVMATMSRTEQFLEGWLSKLKQRELLLTYS